MPLTFLLQLISFVGRKVLKITPQPNLSFCFLQIALIIHSPGKTDRGKKVGEQSKPKNHPKFCFSDLRHCCEATYIRKIRSFYEDR